MGLLQKRVLPRFENSPEFPRLDANDSFDQAIVPLECWRACDADLICNA